MKYFIFICSSLVLLGTTQVFANNSATSLKILSLNFNSETRNVHLKDRRLPLFEAYVRAEDPDVMFFQEAWDYRGEPSFVKIVARDLNYDLFYQIENGVTGYLMSSTAILIKKDLQFTNGIRLKLPHSAFNLGDGQNTFVGFGSISLLVGGEIRLRNGQRATIWDTHLNGGTNSKNRDQVVKAFEIMKNYTTQNGMDWDTTPAIFAGDFNSEPESSPIQFVKEQMGFQDLWAKVHPDDPGITFPGDIDRAEYHPVIHGAKQIPNQYGGPHEFVRLDYTFVRGVQNYAAGITKIFTKPIDHIWMSDHYGLLSEIHFNDDVPFESPVADSRVEDYGPATVFRMNNEALGTLPRKLSIDVNSERGFTLSNEINVFTTIMIDDHENHVYTASDATIGQSNAASFAFEQPGDYKFRLIIRDYRDFYTGRPDYSREPRFFQSEGLLHVKY